MTNKCTSQKLCNIFYFFYLKILSFKHCWFCLFSSLCSSKITWYIYNHLLKRQIQQLVYILLQKNEKESV